MLLLLPATVLLLISGGASGKSCKGIPATLRLDWTAMAGKRAEEATARIERRNDDRSIALTSRGDETCEATGGDEHDGYIAICMYCLEEGEYDLVVTDSWGDGWEKGFYSVEMSGCTALMGLNECETPCRNWGQSSFEKSAYHAFDVSTRPSPAPTFADVTYDTALLLSKEQGDAKATLLRRADNTEMAAYEILYDGEPVFEEQLPFPRCVGEASISFAKAPLADLVQAHYYLPAGNYSVALEGGSVTVTDGYKVYAEATGAVTTDFEIEHGIPSAAPTLLLGPLGMELVLDWTGTSALTMDAGVRLYRVAGPQRKFIDEDEDEATSNLLTEGQFIVPLRPLIGQSSDRRDDESLVSARRNEIVRRQYGLVPADEIIIRVYCWTSGWSGGRYELRRLEDGVVFSSGAAETCGGGVTTVDILVQLPGAPSSVPTSTPTGEGSWPVPTLLPTVSVAPTSRQPTLSHEPTFTHAPTRRPTFTPQPTDHQRPTPRPTTKRPTPRPTPRPTTTPSRAPTQAAVVDSSSSKRSRDDVDTLSGYGLILAMVIVGIIACGSLALAAVMLSRRSNQLDSKRFEDMTRRAMSEALTSMNPMRRQNAYSWSTINDQDIVQFDHDDDDDVPPRDDFGSFDVHLSDTSRRTRRPTLTSPGVEMRSRQQAVEPPWGPNGRRQRHDSEEDSPVYGHNSRPSFPSFGHNEDAEGIFGDDAAGNSKFSFRRKVEKTPSESAEEPEEERTKKKGKPISPIDEIMPEPAPLPLFENLAGHSLIIPPPPVWSTLSKSPAKRRAPPGNPQAPRPAGLAAAGAVTPPPPPPGPLLDEQHTPSELTKI